MPAIDEYLLYLKAERNLSARTRRAYEIDVRQYITFCQRSLGEKADGAGEIIAGRRVSVSNLGLADHLFIRRYLAYLQTKKVKHRSLARKLAALKSFHAFLQQRYGLKTNPFLLVSSPKFKQSLPKVMKYEQVNSLLNLPRRDSLLGRRDRAAMEIFYGSGIRVSELAGLDCGDVNFSAAEIRVFGKGGKERIVPLNEATTAALRDYIANSRPLLLKKGTVETPALFLNYRGARLSSGGLRKIIKKYGEAASIYDLTPHVFRHTFATHLLEGNAGLRAVQELMGHVDLSSTQIYTHLSKRKLREIYKQAHPRA